MKLTVISTVYNQAPFLKQSIESVLSQRTNFEFEYIIANDCSNDNSGEVIAEYAKANSCIKFLDNPVNLGFIKNYAQCLELAKGKYIAGLGGDDYWIDNDKLQMQVDFLENNPDYGMVHTQFDELYMYPKFMQRKYKKNAQKAKPELQGDVFCKLIANNTINANSVCFVKSIIEDCGMIEQFKNEEFLIEDHPMWLQISKNYKVGYINKSTVCYRRNRDSESHFSDPIKIQKFDENIRKVSLSFLTEKEKSDPKVISMMDQYQYLSNTYMYFKKGDLHNFKKNYTKLNCKTFDRRVMLWVLQLKLHYLFNKH